MWIYKYMPLGNSDLELSSQFLILHGKKAVQIELSYGITLLWNQNQFYALFLHENSFAVRSHIWIYFQGDHE